MLDGANMSDQLASLRLHTYNANTHGTDGGPLRSGPPRPRPVVPWNEIPFAVTIAELLATYELSMRRFQGLLDDPSAYHRLTHRIQVADTDLRLKWPQIYHEAVRAAMTLPSENRTFALKSITFLTAIYQQRQDQRILLSSPSHTLRRPVVSSLSGFPIQLTEICDLQVLACTCNMLIHLGFPRVSAASELQYQTQFLTSTNYIDLSQRIQHLLREDSDAVILQADVAALSTSDESQTGRSATPFPAAHIAFLNQHLQHALKIWVEHPEELDILGRPLPFLVVESGNLEMLKAMATHNLAAIINPIVDAGGFFLLDVATIRGDANTFSWLTTAGCYASNPQRLLRFAVITGNSAIVEQIINQHGMGLGPLWTTFILLAIDQMNADVVRVFLPSLGVRNWYSEDVLERVADCAQERGLNSLAAEIRAIEPVYFTAEDALGSLDAIGPQDYGRLLQQRHFSHTGYDCSPYPRNGRTLVHDDSAVHLQCIRKRFAGNRPPLRSPKGT